MTMQLSKVLKPGTNSGYDPKFELEVQFIWGQAMGATQFQVFQLITEGWGVDLRTIYDGPNVVFDVLDASKSLPVLLQDLKVDLLFAKELYRAKAALKGLGYPCSDISGVGFRCTHSDWNEWTNSFLSLYNDDVAYPSNVLRWLQINPATNPSVAFKEEVAYHVLLSP